MAWWRNGQSVGLATPKVAGSTPGLALSGNNLGQVVHTHTCASVTEQYNLVPVKGDTYVMPCGWEGNRRSGVALAVRQTSVVYPPTG